jgi:hypothetical protein
MPYVNKYSDNQGNFTENINNYIREDSVWKIS